MPFVLKHRETSQIYTCMLVNHYQLAYYGVKFWQDEADAREEADAWLLEQGVEVSLANDSSEMKLSSIDPAAWEVFELDEATMKLGNVKLKNDPAYQLFLNEQGRPVAEKAPG